MAELQFGTSSVTGYDQAIGCMTERLIPRLLQSACLAPGQRVLDIACGTGLAAQAAAEMVGPLGYVIAADVSPAMIKRARDRLEGISNIEFVVEDGQSLSFAAESFDAVLCNMGLMYFPDPAQGLSEFRRVLRTGGYLALSVNTTPERSLMSRVLVIIGRHVPSKAADAARLFSLGDKETLQTLLVQAGFGEVKTTTETLRIGFPSFNAYFGGIEQGAGNTGQEYMALPEGLRRAVREEVRLDLGDTGGPIKIAVEIRFGSGKRK